MNEHEYAARRRKAEALAGKLREYGITRDLAKRLTDGEWNSVAMYAGVHAPNSEATRQEVYDRLPETTPKPQVVSIDEFRRIGV